MTFVRLQFFEVLVLDFFMIGVCNHLQIIIKVQTHNIQIKVLLQHFIRLQQLFVLQIHMPLYLAHILKQLVPLDHPLLRKLSQLLLHLLHLLLHGLPLKISLAPYILLLLLIIILFLHE